MGFPRVKRLSAGVCGRSFPARRFLMRTGRPANWSERDRRSGSSIAREFGPAIYSASGDLNREQLRSIVFGDAEKKRALEQILHPRIRRQWSLEAESQRNSTDLFFADIPLLYETGGETLCDSVVVVACSPASCNSNGWWLAPSSTDRPPNK